MKLPKLGHVTDQSRPNHNLFGIKTVAIILP